MNALKRSKVEFGDFQTPLQLANDVCAHLAALQFDPEVVIEPTCGVGAFVLAAAKQFRQAHVFGYEINEPYLEVLDGAVRELNESERVTLTHANFFAADWQSIVRRQPGRLLILGNLPWVTSSVLGGLDSTNLPTKSNFLGHKGFEAITGKANFDISEWMLLHLIRALEGQAYDVAMLLKTATGRKVISYVEKVGLGVDYASIVNIDAKKEFGAAVDASLLVLRFNGEKAASSIEYEVFKKLADPNPTRVGHRAGLMVRDLDRFDDHRALFGESPQKWRSGVKHDASSIMEFTSTGGVLVNGRDEVVSIEDTYLYPLMKGSDIGSNRDWRSKFVLVTQTKTGEDTSHIAKDAKRTWSYLHANADILDARGSSIYAKGHRFSIFGIGDYAFRPWKIAICGLYKKLNFRLIGPIDGKPVMFDDTVYFVSFATESEAIDAYRSITSGSVLAMFDSMIFWDEKRPIKSSVLNTVDWKAAAS